jgi:hypothetical protein
LCFALFNDISRTYQKKKNHFGLFSIFQLFRGEIQTQFGWKIRILLSHNAKKYESTSILPICLAKALSIKYLLFTLHIRMVRQNVRTVIYWKLPISLVSHECLKQFLSDAVLTACYLITWIPSSVLGSAPPHSILLPSSPLFSLPPKIFGCTYYIQNLGPGFDKLDACATKCVFLGYSRTQKGYRYYSPVLRRYFTSADAIFLESTPYFFSVSSPGDFVFESPSSVPFLIPSTLPTSHSELLPAPSLGPL